MARGEVVCMGTAESRRPPRGCATVMRALSAVGGGNDAARAIIEADFLWSIKFFCAKIVGKWLSYTCIPNDVLRVAGLPG